MIKRILLSLIMCAFLPASLMAQGFGKNKIQYEKHNWQYIQSQHYDIYFYDGGERAAEFTAAIAESSYVYISKLLGFKMQERTVIALYNSHNEFKDTNLSSGIQEESVGGFTEFFKNRVAIPYDGSAEQLRHVVHHELTHALMLQYFYGTGPGAIITGVSGFSMPGWFAEGSAEYHSRRWDTESDNFIRDAVLSGYMQPLQYLSGFLAYKGGQSFLYWIERTYGVRKVAELNLTMKQSRNVERSLQVVLGRNSAELTEAWQSDLKKEYWPEISNRKSPKEFAEPVTDHEKNIENFVNNSPAISPDGSRIAYLSDRGGLFYVYMLSTIEGDKAKKLLGGQKQQGFEEFKWLRPGISWSPDSKYICFSAKAGRHDAIYIVDAENGDTKRKFEPNFDGVWSPSWSPDGEHIAFMGANSGQSDIYIWGLEENDLRNVTNDRYSDMEPTWSPDGKWLAYVSDRHVYQTYDSTVSDFPKNLENTDIFITSPDGRNITQITHSPYIEGSPVFYHSSDSLLYISDRNGINNIYLYTKSNEKSKPLTNLRTGADQISVSAKSERLAFTCFENSGYDIYLWKNPFQFADSLATLSLTPFRKREGTSYRDFPFEEQDTTDVDSVQANKPKRMYKNFVFDDQFRRGEIENAIENEAGDVLIPREKRLSPDGLFRKRKYNTKFSIDYIGGFSGYDPFWGVQGYTQIILSDLMGNQQILIGANIIRNIESSDLILGWNYLPNRLDLGFQMFHFANFYSTSFGVERLQRMGGQLQLFYPLSRFKRIETNISLTHLREKNLWFDLPVRTTTALPVTLAFVSDNTDFRFFGPHSGTRYRFDYFGSPNLTESFVSFNTLTGDVRQYYGFATYFSLAFRASGGYSTGKNPIQFILGGLNNWLDYRFARGLNQSNITDFYFSELVTPLRGYDYYHRVGNKYFLINTEFRFPLVDYFILHFPLPIWLTNIRGAGFMDVGSAWTDSFRGTTKNENNVRVLNDIDMSFGWGFRVNLGIMLLRMDAAWLTDMNSVTKPRYLFSVGTDF